MIEQYFKKPETWDRIRACWLFELIEGYIAWLQTNGYASRNVHHRVPILVRFAEFARKRGAKSPGGLPRYVQPFVDEWLKKRGTAFRGDRRQHRTAVEIRGPIEQMLRVALPNFVGRRQARPIPFPEQAPEFIRHLQQERGLAAPTVEEYTIHLRSFEAYLRRIGATELAELSPAILSAFVTERGQAVSRGTMHGVCSTLRIFLRYAHRERLTARDLSSSVEGPRTYRLAALPRSIPWADVQRMLEAVDRRSALGKRDYAMLLLLATYGLRGREVAALTLDDLDWEPVTRQRILCPPSLLRRSSIISRVDDRRRANDASSCAPSLRSGRVTRPACRCVRAITFARPGLRSREQAPTPFGTRASNA